MTATPSSVDQGVGATVKLLHSADIHVDSPLRGLSRSADAPVDELRGATRRAVENLVDLAVTEEVACLLIAGDLYDGDRDDYDTAIFLNRQFSRLVNAGVKVVIAYGNHDAASEITKRLRPPSGVHILGHLQPETITFDDVGLAIHGQSYEKRVVTEDLSAAYPTPISNLLNIGVLHTALTGRPNHDTYAPCTPEGLRARGYDYWALGHVHEREVIVADNQYIVFPGNLQGRHARETGPKGATLIHIDDDRISAIEHHSLDDVRWELLKIDASGAVDVDEVCVRITDAAALATSDDNKLYALRVEIVGATSAADALVSERDSWEAQLRGDLAGAGNRLWLEKVVLATTRPGARPAMSSKALEAVEQAIDRLSEDPAGLQDIARVFDPLRTKLGADQTVLAELDTTTLDASGLRSVLEDVRELLLADLGEL